MRPNPGHLPDDAAGKRVRVTLRNGSRPTGDWAADGRGACRWSLPGRPHDIVAYEVAP